MNREEKQIFNKFQPLWKQIKKKACVIPEDDHMTNYARIANLLISILNTVSLTTSSPKLC